MLRLGGAFVLAAAAGVVLAPLAGAGARGSAGYEASPATPVVSVATSHRVVEVNGKPAFLFGVYAPVDQRVVDLLTPNVLIDVGGDATEQEFADASGGRYWQLVRSRPGVPLAAPLPDEIGTAWMDEPEGHGVSAAELAATPQDGRLNYENFQQQIALGGMVGDSATAALYAPYVANLGRNGAYGFDFYDWNWNSCDNSSVSPGDQYHYVLGAKWTAPPNAPIVDFIETTKLTGACDGELTPDFVVGEAKAAITAGATWINWWDRSDEYTPAATPPDVASAIRVFELQVHALAPILLAAQLPDRSAIASTYVDPLKVGVRTRVVGGRRVYDAILFNASSLRVLVVPHLPGLHAQRVRDVLTGATRQAHAGQLALTIPPHQWMIEEYVPS